MTEEIEFDPTHWDCECETRFIHPKAMKRCPFCGAERDDQPDSRMDEVKQHRSAGDRSIDLVITGKPLHVYREEKINEIAEFMVRGINNDEIDLIDLFINGRVGLEEYSDIELEATLELYVKGDA